MTLKQHYDLSSIVCHILFDIIVISDCQMVNYMKTNITKKSCNVSTTNCLMNNSFIKKYAKKHCIRIW